MRAVSLPRGRVELLRFGDIISPLSLPLGRRLDLGHPIPRLRELEAVRELNRSVRESESDRDGGFGARWDRQRNSRTHAVEKEDCGSRHRRHCCCQDAELRRVAAPHLHVIVDNAKGDT